MSRYATLALIAPGESTAKDVYVPIKDIMYVQKHDPSAGTPVAEVVLRDFRRNEFSKNFRGGTTYAAAKTLLITTLTADVVELDALEINGNPYADVVLVPQGNVREIKATADSKCEILVGTEMNQGLHKIKIDDTVANVVTSLNS